MKHIISLGAGVQSSTMALMAAHGEIKPMPDCAIFADTRDEPSEVYEWLKWLIPELPFNVHWVHKSSASLSDVALEVRISKGGNAYTKSAIPAFIIDDSGKVGLLKRQCTSDFKIEVIQREIRRLRENKETSSQWIGISRDEAIRMKPSRLAYVENRWPLIELGMTRNDCLDWMEAKGYAEPPRSSCVYCPYHNDAEWRRLKAKPSEFEKAVQFERQYQITMKKVANFRGTPYLHRSCVPLDEIDFTKSNAQQSLFGNECEGVCGV